MTDTTLRCSCGETALTVTGSPILTAECCCHDCQSAAAILQSRPGAPAILTDYAATPFVLYRKDRVTPLCGTEHLREHRLSPDSDTRRVVATCCNTPLFLEFQKGHWLSLYAGLWPDPDRPAMAMRTVTKHAPDRSALSVDIPNPKMHTARFYGKLLAAWAAMGFRTPALTYVKGTLDNG